MNNIKNETKKGLLDYNIELMNDIFEIKEKMRKKEDKNKIGNLMEITNHLYQQNSMLQTIIDNNRKECQKAFDLADNYNRMSRKNEEYRRKIDTLEKRTEKMYEIKEGNQKLSKKSKEDDTEIKELKKIIRKLRDKK